jgi:phosphohistidine phosphatase
MNLYVLRHGLAVELGEHGFTRDSERPLTAKGRAKLAHVAAAIHALEISFDKIVSSPYVRARQTAEQVAEAVEFRGKVEFTEALVPGGSPSEVVHLLNRLAPWDHGVLLVGHEPFLSEFISLLVSGHVGLPVVMKKGGLCHLSAESFRLGRCAALEWLLTPKQMGLMA